MIWRLLIDGYLLKILYDSDDGAEEYELERVRNGIVRRILRWGNGNNGTIL